MDLSRAGKIFGPIILLCVVLLLPFLLFAQDLLAFGERFFLTERADISYMVGAALLLAGDSVLPTPSSVVATLLATRVGFWPAAIANWAGMTAGCLLALWLGGGGRGALKRTGYDLPAPLIEWIERNGLLATLLCRPVPVLAEATLILAGAAGIPRRLLFALCAVANLALGCAYAYAGSGGNSGLIDPGAILFGAAVIPVVMTIPVWLLSRVRDIGR